MPGFTKGMRDYYAFLFGDGTDGDAVISANTNLPSIQNGPIVERKYRNLTINPGCTLSVATHCKGLLIRVNEVLTLHGDISMSQRGCFMPGGGSDLYLAFNDIKIPAMGAPGALGRYEQPGADGVNGVDGQCGGGGAGASPAFPTGGNGTAGYGSGGGTGGSGACNAGNVPGQHNAVNGKNALPFGERGGDGIHAWASENDYWHNLYSGGGAGGIAGGAASGGAQSGTDGAGGILIVMARAIIGNGRFLSLGGDAGLGKINYGGPNEDGLSIGGSGGSGGGSIVIFYAVANALNMDASGGKGSPGVKTGTMPERKGGNGGNGSCRAWSLTELASHTRL